MHEERLFTLLSALGMLVLATFPVLSGCSGAGRILGRSGADRPEPAIGSLAGQDFRLEVEYLDDLGEVMGRRWVHTTHGMPVTVLAIQSVPQVFLYVNTPPVSDRGEPHTGEHLLLGKGRKGKLLSAMQGMSMIGSTAYTSQTEVVYSWHCEAGKETFLRSVEQYLDALLCPDYSDEEVRREVCHYGVVERDGTLAVEEKGTIYNEMVSAYERRWTMWREVLAPRAWGENHPLSHSSGGEPGAVREMQPHHIHDFHAAHYHLSANMGMIVALPDSIPEAEFLDHLAGVMRELETTPELIDRPKTVHPISPARPEKDRSLRFHEYPHDDPEEIGTVLLAWPPVALESQEEIILATLLLETLADGDGGPLYERLLDRETRQVEVRASELFGGLEETRIDVLPLVGLDGVPAADIDAGKVERITDIVRRELARITGLAPGSETLRTFNDRALVRLTESQRELRKQLSSPPRFGHRGAGGFWFEHLERVDLEPGTRRSLTLAPAMDRVRERLAVGAGANPWTDIAARLGLDEEPYRCAAIPSPAEKQRRAEAREVRLARFVAALERRFEEQDPQRAIDHYRVEVERATHALELRDRDLPRPHLVDDVPRTLDPSLVLEELEIDGVPGHRGIFDNMSFVETALCLRLDGLEGRHLVWLPLLPDLLTSAGVVTGAGETLGYDEVDQRRGREIYGLVAEYDLRPTHGRRELCLRATGADLEEARRAIVWLERGVCSPWLETDNLPRLRDLIDRALARTRVTLGGREEGWVRNPAEALRFQDDPLYLSAGSLHTAILHLVRCEWLLMPEPRETDLIVLRSTLARMTGLATGDVGTTAARFSRFLDDLETNRVNETWTDPIGRRLVELLGSLDPQSVERDLGWLIGLALADLRTPPETALLELHELSSVLRRRGSARLVLTGSRAHTDAIRPDLERLLARFGTEGAEPRAPGLAFGVVERRLRERTGDDELVPVHHALVHRAASSGVFVLSADAAGLDERREPVLIDELAARVFAGAGPHGFFIQTWGAGLAYSNGTGVSARDQRQRYYAERCPTLVETMKFVTGLVDASQRLEDPGLIEYCVAQAVARSRESDGYEERTRAQASDLVDGNTPERIARYREVLLGYRDRTDLWPAVRDRIAAATGRVLPGIGPDSAEVAGGVFLTIGPPALLDEWQAWLHDHEGEQATLHRLYPRDFWFDPR